MVREDLGFDAALGSYEHHFVALIGCHSSEGKSGHEVATGAAAGDENLHAKNVRGTWYVVRGVNRSSRTNQRFEPRTTHYARESLLARPTLARTPVAARATMSDDRPYDMNGSVTPVAGITARLTPIWSTTLSPIITLIPVASS